jgi:homoserine kinase type II
MAVYTTVTESHAQSIATRLKLGSLRELQGIQGGIENTNYFLTTDQGRWVLTVFERLTAQQLPFYLDLTSHLAGHGIDAPAAVRDAKGTALFEIEGKPAAVVTCLKGKSELSPSAAHCAQIGDALARMHLAARSFDGQQPNLRGLDWWNATAPGLMQHLEPPQQQLLQHELAYQNHVAQSAAHEALPRAAVHGDLFRDNAMFDDDRLSGVFDFYFAGVDSLIFDLAVALNDWCIDLESGAWDCARRDALLHAYTARRASGVEHGSTCIQAMPWTRAERELLGAALRAAALRFWISRLWDWHLPREASLLKPHDPAHFERVLQQRSEGQLLLKFI